MSDAPPLDDQQFLFDPSQFPPVENLPAEPGFRGFDHPVWTDNKAHFIMRYLRYFVFITKHGTYIDGFAGPQPECMTDCWAAKLVLESEPRWMRHFHLCESQNMAICCTSHTQMPFSCMVTNCLPNEAVGGRNGQCFGLYHFSPDGLQHSDNITDWSLAEFRDHYLDQKITKIAIFQYIYAILHHPLYRERFAQNLQKDIPRIPMAPNFYQCAEIGEKLIGLHLGYESVKGFALEWLENPKEPLSYRVTGHMKLNPEAGTIEINSSLTLAGIPPQAFDYVLGTRSAIEWVVDQYRRQHHF